ncbi:unnamed protein product, partial [Urochloa humidicola]
SILSASLRARDAASAGPAAARPCYKMPCLHESRYRVRTPPLFCRPTPTAGSVLEQPHGRGLDRVDGDRSY